MIVFPWNLSFTLSKGELSLDIDQDIETGVTRFTVTNKSAGPLQPSTVEIVSPLAMQAAGASLWIHGRYMQQDALTRVFGADLVGEEGYEGHYRSTGDGIVTYTSHEVAVLTAPSQSQPSLLLACADPGRFPFDVRVTCDEEETALRGLALVFDLEGTVELAPGESHALPAISIEAGTDSVTLIEAFADLVGASHGARVPETPPTGWCSWYEYGNAITEADIRANLDALVSTALPVEFVQIDDGFQSVTGDWLIPNAKFPSGMATMAEEIREAGLRPGLWLAPFVFHEDSATLREHPGMMIHDRAGAIIFADTWLGRCAMLDCTNPIAEAWLRTTISTVVREWGYTYLKLDALAYAAVTAENANYAVPGTTSLRNIRRGLEIIRQAAGASTFLLGCTCHFGPAIGLVDGMRVGPDVKDTWADGTNPSVRHAMRMALQRNWMHGRWWANDPDCLLVREQNSGLSDVERRFLATAIAASGGMVVSSDNLASVTAAGLRVANALIPAGGVAAQPGDVGEGPVPSTWRADLGNKRALVALLNWSEQARWVAAAEFSGPGESAFDTWNGKLAGMGDILLRPHEGLLFQVSAPSRGARIVGDSGHVTMQGLFQREVSGRVQVRNDSARPRTIAIAARMRVTTYELQPGESRWFD